MKHLLFTTMIILLALIPSCLSKKNIMKTDQKLIVKNLEDFFRRSDIDINNAAKVVIKEDMIKNLTHLMMMNHGGRRYFLLEIENIAKMISAVTRGIYSDYILINKKGTIMYTYTNRDIFSKNVRGSMRGTILGRAYSRRDIPILYQDVNTLPSLLDKSCIFISKKVKGKNTYPGIIILQLNIKDILKYIPKGFEIIDYKGIIRISQMRKRIYKKHEDANSLLKDAFLEKPSGHYINSKNKKKFYEKFSHRAIKWLIVDSSYYLKSAGGSH